MYRPIAALFSASLLMLAAPAVAQDEDDPYGDCAAIEVDTERLACFDATYVEQRVVTAELSEREEERREEAFGFRGGAAASDTSQDDVAVSATVTEVLQGARRSQVLLMDNGQLWREISGSTLRNRIREGWTATITQHWSGAYEMRFEGRSGYLRVARLQ